MVVGVNGTAEGESTLVGGVWECVEMNLEGVEDAEEVEGVLVGDAQFGEGIAEDGGVRFCCCEDDSKHVVDFGHFFWCRHSDFFGGDNVEDCGSCLEAAEFFGEGASWHVAFPAILEGDENEVAEVAVVVGVVLFVGSEDGAWTNAVDEELEAFIHVVDVWGRDC